LFSQVIMESGAATARFCQPPDSAIQETQFHNLTTAVGVNTVNASDDDILEGLRAMPLAAIANASEQIFSFYNPSIRWPWQPAIDGPGGVIPQAPIDIWGTGTWNKVPILTGYCDNEGATFVPNTNTSLQFTEFFQTLNPNLTASEINTINQLYPDPLTTSDLIYLQTQPGKGPEFNRLAAAYGEFAYISPVRHTAHFASTSPSLPPVFLYEVGINSSVTLGTGHDCATDYVTFVPNIVGLSQTQSQLAAAVNEYWTSFIVAGDPNALVGKAPGRVRWPQYTPSDTVPNKVVIGRGNDERAGGKDLGVVSQAVVESKFVTNGNFWWSRVVNTENS
jgi:acetylcholinesterase